MRGILNDLTLKKQELEPTPKKPAAYKEGGER